MFVGRALAFVALDDGEVRTGVWDRITSWGEKIKDGDTVEFNEITLGQMVDNWQSRGDLLSVCYDHQSAFVEVNGSPAPALAFYDALAIVRQGKVVRFSHLDGSAAQEPSSNLPDGLYGFRAEVTPLGRQLLPNYRYLSPLFTDLGSDEKGNQIGYVLFDVAATNSPFQAGCEIQFSAGRARPNQEQKMDEQTLKRFGLDAGADESACKAALKKFADEKAIGFADADPEKLEEAAKELLEAAQAIEAQYPAEGERMRRMAKKFGEIAKMEPVKMARYKIISTKATREIEGSLADAKKAARAMNDELQPSFGVTIEDENGNTVGEVSMAVDEDEKKQLASDLGCEPKMSAIRQAVATLRFTSAPKTEIATLRQQIAALEADKAKREQDARETEIVSFARQAIADGAWDSGDESGLIAFRRSAPEAAEKHVAANKGKWTALARITTGGAPRGTARTESTFPVEGVKGLEFSRLSKAYASEHKCSLREAQVAVARTNPDLAREAMGINQ